MANKGRPKAERIVVKCVACEKEIERYSWQVERNKTGRFFCSKECRNEIGVKPRKKQNVKCQTCGKMFYPSSGGKGIYCSRACHNVGQTKRIDKACEICGKLFEAKPSDLIDRVVKTKDRQYVARAKKFCSKECQGRALWQRPQKRTHNGKPVLLTPDGYVKVWEPDRLPRRRWVLEHRSVLEKKLGRKLESDEHVHHINGNKSDNSPENLMILSNSDHGVITGTNNWAELERYRQLYGPLPEDD
jgi:ribosomal protein S27E